MTYVLIRIKKSILYEKDAKIDTKNYIGISLYDDAI